VSHRHVCVHGHFYQPPCENPWLGEIEREDSAYPFHDWNDRVAEECYGPATLGVRGGTDGRAIAYEDLLRRLSFDFGPTLLSWLERKRPSLYRRVIKADLLSARSDGLGNAIAHPAFHVILPLASRRDKETLVRWGIADFKARFSRRPAGFWLPETAVDDETLDVLAAEGIEFTILAPSQAAASRPVGGEWRDETAETLDPKTPYRWSSPKDPMRSLAVFFYHDRLSRGVVSGETVASAEGFAQAVRARLMPGDAAQMVHIASDGEFYGHHHPGAERVLALALDVLADEGIEPVNHSRFLKLFPPPHEVRVRPNTAWSCGHGLGRWERDCGCRLDPGTTQGWRGPLRDALERLARRLDAFFEDDASRFFDDPWAARDASAALWLDRRPDAAERFLAAHAKRPLNGEEETRALRLLMLQRERLAMFTSCGWFFDDVSGVETVQILQRAARALDLAGLLGEEAEAGFLERLAEAESNERSFGDGAGVYRRLVLTARAGLDRLAAHASILEHLKLAPAPWPGVFRVELGPVFEATKMGLAGRDRTLSARPASAARSDTRESASWNVIVHRADRLDFACWFAPAGAFDAAALGGEFLALGDDAFRTALDERWGPARFGLDAVLSDERAELVKALAPDSALGPERAAFLERWAESVTAARGGGRDDDAVLELLGRASQLSFSPEELPWARVLEEGLHARLEEALESGGAAAVSRALRWLDALWAAGLITGVWRLRDFQRRWAEKLARAGASAEKDACRALGERLGLAETLLENSTW
jgi:alpha-amylase/alpha-mannosidase (GH57 family)